MLIMQNVNGKRKKAPKLEITEFSPPINYQTNRKGPIRWVLSHIWHYKKFMIPMMFFKITAVIFQSLIPVFIGIIINDYNNHILTDTIIIQLVMTIFAVGIGAALFNLLGNWSIEVSSQRLERDTRDELYSSLIGKSLTFHDNQTIGDLMSRAATDVRQLNLMLNPGLSLVLQAVLGILIPITFIYFINPQLLLVPIIFIIFFIVFLRSYNRKYGPVAYMQRVLSGTITGRLNEVITGIFVVRGMGQEEKERSIFYKNIKDYRQNTIEQGDIIARYYPLLFFGIATVFSLLHGVILLNLGWIQVGDLVTFIGLIALLRFPTFINIFALTVLSLGVQSAKRVLQILNWESEIDLNPSGHSQLIKGYIKFDNVTFGYNPVKPVLEKVNFSIEPGQTIALVGMTGSGKTTITKLLTRLYEPQEGTITIDGITLREWSINALRSQTAIVEQDVFLFSKTINENIAFGMNASMDEIIEAAKKAQAHNFIMNLPEGYNSVIGERGFTLSGGQRQRIAIARAILRNPAILILDDASSAIDSRTEDEIQTAIRTVLKDRVSFLITHRLAQIRRADKIILMDKGQVLGIGSHNDLLRTNKVYKSIFSSFDEYEKVYGTIEKGVGA